MTNKENTNKKYIWFILIGLLIVVAIFATGITLSLEKTVEENGLRMTKGDNGYILEKVLNKNLQEIVVPDEVVEIREGAFAGCNRLEILNIPFIGKDNVKTVDRFPIGYLFGEKEFEGAQEVKQYYRGFTLAYPESAFYYIPTSLRKVVVRGGEVPLGAFQGCDMLTDVVLPDSATTIGNSALEGCVAIKTLVVGENVTKVGGNAFDGVTPEKYTAPTSVLMRLSPEKAKEVTIRGGERIESGAFMACPELTTVIIEEGVRSIGSSAFKYCAKLRTICLPKSLEKAGSDAFLGIGTSSVYYDGRIEDWLSIEIENGGSLPNRVAEWYVQGERIKELVIPEGVTEIPGYHFYYWRFTKLTIPTTLKKVDPFAFYETSIEDGVWYDGTLEQWCEIEFSAGSRCNPLWKSGRLYIRGKRVLELTIPSTLTETNGCFCGGEFKKIVIPSNVKKIGYYEFAYDELLEEVVFEEGVEEIDFNAFMDCTSLKKIVFPSTLKRIGHSAFRGCKALRNIEFNDGLETIDTYAFENCKKLKEVVLPESVKSIKEGVFTGCENLQRVVVPQGVKKISDRVFYGCSSLEEVTLPDGLTEIGSNAFDGCSKWLVSIDIPDSVTTIGSGAFKGCESLESIRLPSALEQLDVGAFFGCTALTTVDFSETKVDTLRISTFRGCRFMERIELPSTMLYIERDAFTDCKWLSEVIILGETYYIESGAFNGCDWLEEIYYGGTMSKWGGVFHYDKKPSGLTVHCSDGDIVYE